MTNQSKGSEIDFAAIANGVLAVLEGHDMDARGLAVILTYTAGMFDALVTASNREPRDRARDGH